MRISVNKTGFKTSGFLQITETNVILESEISLLKAGQQLLTSSLKWINKIGINSVYKHSFKSWHAMSYFFWDGIKSVWSFLCIKKRIRKKVLIF